MDDLTDIFIYIARDDEGAARDFVADLNTKVEWIAATGFTGAPRDWIRSGLRALPYRNRCIYYRIEGDAVHVLRVVHGRQDVLGQEMQ